MPNILSTASISKALANFCCCEEITHVSWLFLATGHSCLLSVILANFKVVGRRRDFCRRLSAAARRPN